MKQHQVLGMQVSALHTGYNLGSDTTHEKLYAKGVETVAHLTRMTAKEVRALPGIGDSRLAYIRAALRRLSAASGITVKLKDD